MRTTPLSALFFIASVAVCFEESPWQPVSYDYYHIDLSELGGHPRVPLHDHGGFGSKVPVPRDAIVDVINELGIKLLAIHNEHNENNIAISPYGAFSVLAALSEGLQGDSAHEILHAAHIPKDKHIIRVGLRDIHRHLKSYFIPEEGFLAGLTLNLNNVTLRSEYEDVLRFYGFDYGSFNNALYPDPPTTRKPSEATTLETGLGLPEDSSTTSASKPELTTSTDVDVLTRSGAETTEKPTDAAPTDSDTTTIKTTTVASKDETTTSATSLTTVETTLTSTVKSEVLTTTTESPTTQPVTAPSPTAAATTTESSEVTTDAITERKEDSTTTPATTTETTSSLPETTTKLPEITTATTVEESTTETRREGFVTSKFVESTIVSLATAATTVSMQTASVRMGTTVVNSNTVRTTREATFPMEPEGLLTTVSPTQATTVTDAATTPIATTFDSSDVQSDFPDGPVTTLPQFGDQEQDAAVETTTPFFFGATPDFQDNMANLAPNQNFDFNYNYDANGVPPPPVYDDSMVDNNLMPNPPEAQGLNNNVRRTARSIVDYVIARFYDDHHHYPASSAGPPYVPQEPLTFAVYGKHRDSGVNFMKYDTVLPYFFAQNLKAVALNFPLDSTKYYLLLLLPVRENGVDQLICDLRLYGNLRYIINNLRLTHVVATIPSFTLKGYVTLTPALQRLGIRKIFEPRQADFTPMTNVTDIYVTNIEQAVTVTIRNYLDSSAQHYKNVRQYPPIDFKADHPFLYFVIDSELHVALMVGKVINPLNSRIS